MPVIPYNGKPPVIHESVFMAPDAWVTGDVTLGENCSLFFGAVARGDINPVIVGAGTNIQEKVTLHTSHGLGPCSIGCRVTVGHHAIVHGCTVEDECIIGMGAVLLDGAVIGKHSIIGAQALVPMNMRIPESSLVVGVPARVVRKITDDERVSIIKSAESYITTGQRYKSYFQSAAL